MRSRSHSSRSTCLAAAFAATSLSALLLSPTASAQMVEAGRRGSIVFDDISGFRASSVGGVGYSGPIGFSFQSLNETVFNAGGDTQTTHFTNFWFAPSLDVFLINHLSLGGLIEVGVTSASVDYYAIRLGTTTTTSLPTTVDVTILPRVGWLFDVTERFGIWPRLGLGWAERQTAAATGVGVVSVNNTETEQSFIFDLDCGFIYRLTPDWFLRAAPEFTFGPGSHSETAGNTSISANATFAAFALSGGFGFMWNR
jgi:hypothetical protein